MSRENTYTIITFHVIIEKILLNNKYMVNFIYVLIYNLIGMGKYYNAVCTKIIDFYF